MLKRLILLSALASLVSAASSANASCLIQNDIELSDERLSTREAWAHCSLEDARLYDSFFQTQLRGYLTLRELPSVTSDRRLLFAGREKQVAINRAVMRKTLLPVNEGGEARRALLNVQSDYEDLVTGKRFALSGVGTLIAQVDRLPDNRMTPLNPKTRYYVLTAAHLVSGDNARVFDNLGSSLKLGKMYFDDQSDLAVIEITADPLIQPLAYLNPKARSQKLATYLFDVGSTSHETADRFSGFSYPVTPTASVAGWASFRSPGFFLGQFQQTPESRSLYSFPLLSRKEDGSTSIDRSVRAGLSGTPLFADIGERYLSLTGVATYSAEAGSGTTAASSDVILKILMKAALRMTAESNGRWVFINGLPVFQSEDETRIFVTEKPIGNGVYVNGKTKGEMAESVRIANPVAKPNVKPKLSVKLTTKFEVQLLPLKHVLGGAESNDPRVLSPPVLVERLRRHDIRATVR